MVELKNVKLPETFFEEEERSGYLVKKENKKMWAVQMDLLMELDNVCRAHDIRYFIMYGSLLGVVRHKGFIPWDDDIDVIISRSEYNKLLKYISDFKEPYFFQTDYTDSGSHTYCPKLRNSNTAAILRPEVECKYTYNQGIFLDIFVMDNVPDDEDEYLLHQKNIEKAWMASNRFARFFQGRRFNSRRKIAYAFVPLIYIVKFFIKLFNIKNIPLRKWDKLAQKYNNVETKRWTHYGLGAEFPYDKEWFKDVVYLDFENLKVPCPKDYEKILESKYGNWRKFEIGSESHVMAIVDTDKSYKEYL